MDMIYFVEFVSLYVTSEDEAWEEDLAQNRPHEHETLGSTA